MRKNRGEIKKISDLFEVYTKRLRPPQGSVIKAFQEVILDLTGHEIKRRQCSYTVTTKTLILNAPGPLKSEIFIRKQEILNHLKGRLGEGNAPKEII